MSVLTAVIIGGYASALIFIVVLVVMVRRHRRHRCDVSFDQHAEGALRMLGAKGPRHD